MTGNRSLGMLLVASIFVEERWATVDSASFLLWKRMKNRSRTDPNILWRANPKPLQMVYFSLVTPKTLLY